MRGRSRSYSPSPPTSYRRRGLSPSPGGHYGGHGRDLPTSLLVRNLRHGCKPEDLRKPFGQFGPLKDVYLPLDYYTRYEDKSSFKSPEEEDVSNFQDIGGKGEEMGLKFIHFEDVQVLKNLKSSLKAREPRGFGFVQYVDPADAAEAKYQMDGQILFGRELTVVFAEENRKKPADMRARERGSGRSYDRRSPRNARSSRYSRSRSPRYSRSPRRGRSRSRSPPRKRSYSPSPRKRSYSPSPKQREYSRSISPEQRAHSERSYSRSPVSNRSKSRSPPYMEDRRGRSVRERSRSVG